MRPRSALESRISQRPVAQPKGRSAALTIAAAVCVTLLAVVALRLAGRGGTFSHRVVVGASGCGPACDAQAARALAAELSGLGFDAVAPGGLRDPDAVREFARDHGARFAVMLLVAVEQSRSLEDAVQRVGANASLYVIDVESETPPKPAFVLRGVEEAPDERSALSALALRLLRGLSPVTSSALLASEPVRAMQRDASGLEQQASALALKKHDKDLLAREQAIREYRTYCEANAETLASAEGSLCVSDGCAEEYLVGILPDGSAAVVHDSTDAAVFPLAPDSTARGFPTSERLWLVPRRGARKLLAEAANFYSRPELSTSGTILAFVEYRLGQARLYVQNVASGERRLVHRVTAPRQLTQPRLSPDGSQLLFYELTERGGPAALKIADLARPDQHRQLLPHALDARFATLPLAPGKPLRRLVAALVPSADASASAAEASAAPGDVTLVDLTHPALLLLDPATGEVLAAERDLPHHVRAIGDVHRDELLLGFEDIACGFARYAPGRPITWSRTELCPKHIVSGRDGVYAHALGGTPFRQLVRIDVEAGRLEVLTSGALDVQNPKPAPAGPGLAYERVLPRKYGELQHVAVCFDAR